MTLTDRVHTAESTAEPQPVRGRASSGRDAESNQRQCMMSLQPALLPWCTTARRSPVISPRRSPRGTWCPDYSAHLHPPAPPPAGTAPPPAGTAPQRGRDPSPRLRPCGSTVRDSTAHLDRPDRHQRGTGARDDSRKATQSDGTQQHSNAHSHTPAGSARCCSDRCCSFGPPLRGGVQRLLHAFPTFIQRAHAALRTCVPLLRCLSNILCSARSILLYASSVTVAPTETDLRGSTALTTATNQSRTGTEMQSVRWSRQQQTHSAAQHTRARAAGNSVRGHAHLCCSLGPPLHSRLQRLLHAASAVVYDAQIVLRTCFSLLCRLLVELHSAREILLHPVAVLITHAEVALRFGVTLAAESKRWQHARESRQSEGEEQGSGTDDASNECIGPFSLALLPCYTTERPSPTTSPRRFRCST